MSAFLDDVAAASLPVAVVLLVLAAVARAVLWAAIDDLWAQRTAQQYLEPLGTWSLIAVVSYAVGLGAAGKASLPSLGLVLLLAAAAVLLRPTGETTRPAAVEPEERPTAPAPAAEMPAAPAAPATAPLPATDAALWANRVGEDSRRHQGLWGR